MLKTAAGRAANLLNKGIPMHQLPSELWTRIFPLAIGHGSEQHPNEIIALTHVCRYWRTVLLSYPRIWSTIRMRPGNPSIISDWLARGQKTPLTVFAEFEDMDDHPQCRYQDPVTATLADIDTPEVCPRHKAVLSLDQLLPHRSRICDLSILFHASGEAGWGNGYEEYYGLEPPLLHHRFFAEAFPNLQRVEFRAIRLDSDVGMIAAPNSMFAKSLPRLKELKYLGAVGGPLATAENLDSCEIGHQSGSAEPARIYPEQLQTLLENNKTLKSLTINWCELTTGVPTATPVTDLKFLKIGCHSREYLSEILDCIHAPQFKNLDTTELSFVEGGIQGVLSDSSGLALEFSQDDWHDLNIYPLGRWGAEITTLRLNRGATLEPRDNMEWDKPKCPGWSEIIGCFKEVQVLELHETIADCDGAVLCAEFSSYSLPQLEVIRVSIDGYCARTLQLLAPVLKKRMVAKAPLAAVEPLLVNGEGGLSQELRAKWDGYYEAAGIRNFLPK